MNYRLIDFGDGRRLDSIGDYLIDRPCPAAAGMRRQTPRAWQTADAVFGGSRDSSGWVFHSPWPEDLCLQGEDFRIPARPTPFGHMGFFPEQQQNWQWIQDVIRRWDGARVLNLFGYTGASTLAAAARGAQVTHVDAAKPNVVAARRAAEWSRLQDAPIRYLIDDARKFVARELRRSKQYDFVILDPPAYGHAGRSSAWRLERDLWPLLDQCLQLIVPERGALLLTGHSPTVDHRQSKQWIGEQRPGGRVQAGRSMLRSEDGRNLDAGFYVRVIWQ